MLRLSPSESVPLCLIRLWDAETRRRPDALAVSNEMFVPSPLATDRPSRGLFGVTTPNRDPLGAVSADSGATVYVHVDSPSGDPIPAHDPHARPLWTFYGFPKPERGSSEGRTSADPRLVGECFDTALELHHDCVFGSFTAEHLGKVPLAEVVGDHICLRDRLRTFCRETLAPRWTRTPPTKSCEVRPSRCWSSTGSTVRRGVATRAPGGAQGAGGQQDDRCQGENDVCHVSVMAKEQRQHHDHDGRRKELGCVADQELPPESAERTQRRER